MCYFYGFLFNKQTEIPQDLIRCSEICFQYNPKTKKNLEYKESGIQRIWNTKNLEYKESGIQRIWNTKNLEYKESGV